MKINKVTHAHTHTHTKCLTFTSLSNNILHSADITIISFLECTYMKMWYIYSTKYIRVYQKVMNNHISTCETSQRPHSKLWVMVLCTFFTTSCSIPVCMCRGCKFSGKQSPFLTHNSK
jgi:hypothetical protein